MGSNIINSTFNASSFEDRAISHVCLDTEPVPDTNGFPTRQCQRIRSETFFPSCWDGVNLDSSTHKDHVRLCSPASLHAIC